MTFRYVYLGWYSNWGFWKATNGLIVLDLWKFRFAFGRMNKSLGVRAANRRMERYFWNIK